MKKILVTVLLIGASFYSQAQITQEGRVEFETKEGGIGATATLGNKGVLVLVLLRSPAMIPGKLPFMM